MDRISRSQSIPIHLAVLRSDRGLDLITVLHLLWFRTFFNVRNVSV